MVDILLLVHVIAGILALLIGFLIFFARKGDMRHVNLGTIYVYVMYLVFITGTYVSIVHWNIFLLVVGFFSFYLVLTGVWYNKARSVAMISLFNVAITLLFALIYFSMLLLAIYAFIKGAYSITIILSAFTFIGFLMNKDDINYFVRKKQPANRLFWKKEHIARMTASYIAAFTAFAVNNIHFKPDFLVWLLPTAIGIPLIFYFIKRYT